MPQKQWQRGLLEKELGHLSGLMALFYFLIEVWVTQLYTCTKAASVR